MSHPRLDIPKPPEPKESQLHERAAMQRTTSLPQRGNSTLDLTGAAISQPLLEHSKDAPSILLPHQDAEYVSHIAIDIGGSLLKLVYFLPEEMSEGDTDNKSAKHTGGKLHFVKFETAKITQAMDFIKANCLHMFRNGSKSPQEVVRIKATGGGAYKFADIFQERLGVLLEKEDEMDCAVSGCNFLLKAVQHEAFSYEDGQAVFTSGEMTLFPYLLVNIGSGVSMIKVDGDGTFERVSGSSLGGGTFWGLCRLLTGCKNFDEMLELSARGDNAKVDMLVGDIYGNRDYTNIGLSADTIASSFGRVVSDDLDLADTSPADVAMALCRMVSYNIAHLSYLNAKRYGLPRIFFGGFFIRGHSYTMETISFAIRFWSKGEMSAKFLRHEGYLGAVGAFLKVHPMPTVPEAGNDHAQRKVRARFVERFSMGTGGEAGNQSFRGLDDKVSWVEKFVRVGASGMEAAHDEYNRIRQQDDAAAETETTLQPLQSLSSINLNVGVLHYTPGQEPFPLLSDPANYLPDTTDLTDRAELEYWVNGLAGHIPLVVEKAISTDGNTPDAKRRASAFRRAFAAQLAKLKSEPAAYGNIGLGELFEMREESLREFGFTDVYRLDKERENAAALEVFPDLLKELDSMGPEQRLTALVEGVLAANIFDWGARACVDLYHQGTILEIYREARTKLSKRPWRVDQFDEFAGAWFSGPASPSKQAAAQQGTQLLSPFRRVIMFVDNAGADVVLGMIPLARELLRMGAEVVLCANSLPAINDITAQELRELIDKVADMCPIIKGAREAAIRARDLHGGGVPPFPGLRRRAPSVPRHLSELNAADEQGSSLDNGSNSSRSQKSALAGQGSSPPHPSTEKEKASGDSEDESPALKEEGGHGASPTLPLHLQSPPYKREARLYIVSNGQGSPCLDLRRVPASLADATVGTDLVILEGMGRAIHTNLRASFRCPTLKLAMIKTQHLAARLFQGKIYDCVCIYEPGSVVGPT